MQGPPLCQLGQLAVVQFMNTSVPVPDAGMELARDRDVEHPTVNCQLGQQALQLSQYLLGLESGRAIIT